MRLTRALFKQHIGFHFDKHWKAQGKRRVQDTGAIKSLKLKGIPIFTPEEILKEKRESEKIEVVGYKPKPIQFDETHPNWHSRILLSYRDDNVLLEGLQQAKVITKTVELQNGLPDSVKLPDSKKEHDERIKKIILSSHVFDAEQKKLPKVKDPERPAWNFPRTYGITADRINNLIMSRLLNHIETTSKPDLVRERSVLNDLYFSYTFEKADNLIQFRLRGDTVLTSSKPLRAITSENTDTLDLPELFPIQYTITLNEENIYNLENIYPIKSTAVKSHPHTLFVYYNPSEVKNLFEEEVTEKQIYGRSLLKAFTAAAAYAKQRFGGDTKVLPKPVTLQCIQTDGRLFHFGVLQLNTLDLEEGGVKNIWYQSEMIPLFEKCCYSGGKPILEGYNREVIRHLTAFYNNV